MSIRSLSVAALGAALLAAPALAALGTNVSGQGMLDPSRTFAVNARVNADGTASGTATLINRSFSGDRGVGPYQAHIEISCGRMIDQRTMVLGGFASRTNDSNLREAVFFSVRDNGEPGAGRDEISRAYFWDSDPNTTGNPMACLQSDVFPMETIRNGNINVQVTM